MRLACLACVMCFAGCGDDDAPPDGGDGTPREEVAVISATPNRDLDMLFVVDDSPTMLDKQESVKAAFPRFVELLAMNQGGLPNLHIGVVTTDLGTRGAEDELPGPQIGSGPGSCKDLGDGGVLQTNSSPLVTGNFISDVDVDGTRMTNYTGTLADAFSAFASVGAQGCGFEQPLEAAKVALDNNAANAGFLRPTANLAVIFVTDEDDCSVAQTELMSGDTATLGPLQSFRCTRFGVTCDVNGTTPDEMNLATVEKSDKSGCHSNEASAYLTHVDTYPPWFKALKPRPEMVMFAALAGPTTPVKVELRTPPGGGTAIPTLVESCTYTTGLGMAVAYPPVRLAQTVAQFGRNAFENVCNNDVSAQLGVIANRVNGMIGDTCLTRSIAMPANCVVTDQNSTGTKTLPKCGTGDCWELVADPAACVSFDHLYINIKRASPPPADTVTTVRCVVP